MMLSFVLNAKQLYQIQDLEVLAQGEQHEEFFLHVEDIPPRQREMKWKELLESMATSFGKKLSNRPVISEKTLSQYDALYRFPSLRNDEFFLRFRSKLGLNYLGHCLNQIPQKIDCALWVDHLWDRSLKDPELAYQLWRLLKMHTPSKKLVKIQSQQLIPFFLAGQYAEFYCEKSSVQEELWTHFKENHEALPGLESACHRATLKNWKSNLTGNSKLSTKLFYFLKKEKILSEQEQAKFLLKTVLSAPEPGDLLNSAWTFLGKLKTNPALRLGLLSSFQTSGNWPGKSFSPEHQEFGKILMKKMNTDFPEYLDQYARSCLKLFKGIDLFSLQGADPYCPSFFKLAEQTSAIPLTLVQDYKKFQLAFKGKAPSPFSSPTPESL